MDDEDATIVRVDPRELQAMTAQARPPLPSETKVDTKVERHSLSDETTNSDDRLRESVATVVAPWTGAPASAPSNADLAVSSNPPTQASADPGESISSINVSRGLHPFGSMPPAAQQTFLSDPPEPPLKSNRRLVMGIAAVGVAALLGIVIVLSTGGSPEGNAASSAQATEKPVATEKPSETAARQATAVGVINEPSAAPSTSAPSSASAVVSAKPIETSKSNSGGSGGQAGAKPKPKGTDPLRDLGSGITLQPKKR